MRALVILAKGNDSELANDGYLLMEDGGVATFHHNGEHMIATYYQDRMTEESKGHEDIWELLGEGKTYAKDYEGCDNITEVMIAEALDWLCPMELNEYNIVDESEKLTAGQQYGLFLERCFNSDFDENMS